MFTINLQGMRLLFFIFSLLFSLSVFSQTTVSGKVTDNKNKPLQGASITIVDSYDGATSAADGSFSFSTTEKGKHIIEVTLTGYSTFNTTIELTGKAITVTATIKESITELNAVVITAGSFEASDKKKGTVLSSLDIVTTASANADITGALKTLPGTQQVGESEGLFVRGGTATESKIFIDGQLVNNFFYSSLPGLATRGRFNPFLFKGTIFSTGGYSALYGQALSSALVLESNDLPEKTEASVDISILSLGGGIQKLSKDKKSSWGITYGHTNLALAFKLIKQSPDFFKTPVYHTADANFRIKTKGGIIKYYGYGSANKLGFRNKDIDSSNLRNSFNLQNLNTFNNVTWVERIGNGWKLQTGISYSTNKDEIENTLINDADQKVITPQPYAFKNFDLESKGGYAQGRIVGEKRIQGLNTIRLGMDHFYSRESLTYTLYDGNKFKDTVSDNLTAAFAETDVYLNKNLAAKIGVRGEYTSLLDKYNFAPRISLAYKIKNQGQASFAYGIFYQNPERRYLPTTTPDLAFSKATHYILQYQKFKNDRIFRTEVFYKDYNNLYKTGINAVGQNSAINNNGKGYAQGVEVFWRDKKSIKNLDYWVSYSYLDTKRDYLNFPTTMTPNFAAKHTASLVMKKFILPIKTGFNASYSFATGRPYYNLKYDNNTNKTIVADMGKTINYNSLGFSVNYLPNLGKKDAKVFSVVVLSVTNILGQNQIFGYNYGAINNTKEAIRPPSKSFVFVGWFLSFGVDRTNNVINNNL